MTAAAALGLAGLLALGKKLVDFARMVTNWRTERSGAVTQAAAWAVFVGLVFLFGAAQTGARVELVPGLVLADLNGWAKVILGLQLGSGAGLVADFLQARDNHDSQALPPLRVPGTGPDVSAHSAEPTGESGPIIPDATVTVRPVLDEEAMAALVAHVNEGIGATLDAAAAAAVAKATAVPPPNTEPG